MRIGLCGTMSVGKTTLVKELANLYRFDGYKFTTERSKYLMEQGIPLNNDSTVRGQLVFMSERSLEVMQPDIITDRTIWDVCAFTMCSKEINKTHKEMLISAGMLIKDYYDYVFYIDPVGTDIEDNGVRTTDPEYRNKIDEKIKYLLKTYKPKRLHTISGTTEERISQIMRILDTVPPF
jgi:nicotinamide riboside kinase